MVNGIGPAPPGALRGSRKRSSQSASWPGSSLTTPGTTAAQPPTSPVTTNRTPTCCGPWLVTLTTPSTSLPAAAVRLDGDSSTETGICRSNLRGLQDGAVDH